MEEYGGKRSRGCDDDTLSNQKYRPRIDPLEFESRLKTMVPLSSISKKQWDEWYERYSISNPSAKIIKAKVDSATAVREINTTFVLEFKEWLQGRSRWNVEMKEDGVTPCTQWGAQDLFHLPGVVPYLRSFLEKKATYQVKLASLYLRGPKDLNQAFLYYKYIVRGDQ